MKSPRKIKVVFDDGTVKYYPSMGAASRDIGVSIYQLVEAVLKRHGVNLYCDIVSVEDYSGECNEYRIHPKSYYVESYTKATAFYKTIQEIADTYDLTRMAVADMIRTGRGKRTHRDIIRIGPVDLFDPLPKSSHGNVVMELDGDMYFYSSMREICRATKLHKSVVKKVMDSGQLWYHLDHSVRIYTLTKEETSK